jgi:hypothetical protein
MPSIVVVDLECGASPAGYHACATGSSVEAGKRIEERRMFWWIVLVAVVVLGALAWWSSGRQRTGVNDAGVAQRRKIDEGRSSRPGHG